MRITQVDVFPVRVPMRPNTVNSPEFPDEALDHFDKLPKCMVKVHTTEGLIGIGETSRGEKPEAVAQAAKALEGQDVLQMNRRQLPPGPDPGGALQIALYDLLGKYMGWPVYQFLGGAVREWVPVDYWMGRCTPEECARRAHLARDLGFHGIKMKAKRGDPVLERVRAIAEVDPNLALILDANGRFETLEESLRLARQVADYPITAFESPMPQQRLDWYVQFRRESPVPVALHLGDARTVLQAIQMGAADAFNLSAPMPQFMVLAHLADVAGIPHWHGSGVDLGIRDASYLHACAAAPSCTLPSDILSHLRADDLIVEGIHIENGHARVPQGPGLGVTLDEDALERYRIG